MKRINYISNLIVANDGGGWNGMNRNIHHQLSKHADVNLIEDVNPVIPFFSRLLSKVERTLGLRARFPAFTASRLDKIASIVNGRLHTDADLNFFHGSTPWLAVKNDLPYACYLDANFATYLAIYHRSDRFKTKDIFNHEKYFLDKAIAVFFSSSWSLEQTKSVYSLQGKNFYTAGLGGNLPILNPLPPTVRNRFVFVGLDYKGKGGNLVSEAFRIFSSNHTNVKLTFVGQEPPPDVLKLPNVEYAGYLDKNQESGLREFQRILTESIALVLPTNRDLTPLVIIEAGYYGTPSIATRVYGIPEIISSYGTLCNAPAQADEIASAMANQYNRKSDAELIRKFYVADFTWNVVGEKINATLNKLLGV